MTSNGTAGPALVSEEMSRSLLSPRRPARRTRRADDATDRPDPPPEPHTDRRAPAPEDLALYACGCGYVFKAVPTTTIGCPHCGDQQAW